MIVETLVRPRSRSCIIDGEAVCCDDTGVRASTHEDRMPTHGYEATREAAMGRPPRAGGGNS